MTAGNAAKAEEVFRKDLEHYPHNGWSMFGLKQALEAQDKDTAEIEAHLSHVWGKADIELKSAVTV